MINSSVSVTSHLLHVPYVYITTALRNLLGH